MTFQIPSTHLAFVARAIRRHIYRLLSVTMLLATPISLSATTAYEQAILQEIPNSRGAQCANGFEDELFVESKECSQLRRRPTYSIPSSPGVRPSGNNRAFVLIEVMNYEVGSTGISINIPPGFVTDYASIPRPLWGLYSPHDQYSRAAIVHDYLYWTQNCTRLQADNLFMIAMKESDVPLSTRNAVYGGVRHWGESSWERNAADREKGVPRVVPVGRRDFPPNWTWEMYQARLISQKVKDPVFEMGDYCKLGNSTDVPYLKLQKSNPKPPIVQRPIR